MARSIHPIVVGTAGHIDHGKTTLVRALTGVDTDRLPEEKKRGISIELGYAFLDVPGQPAGGERIGFIDVPGHERLVRNMLAGVAAIDLALLVVAADDGPMPQTREHLAILDLLGVHHGVVALTKSLAKELVRHWITVNAVALGLVETSHTDPAWLDANRDKILKFYPLRRLGKPDDIAPTVTFLATANAAQAGGVDLGGASGQPLFSGSGAAGIALALTSGSGLATAPAGAGAGSRNPANLNALTTALGTADISGRIDGLLFTVSSTVQGNQVTADTLGSIASSAKQALDSQAGVNLDEEAVNLVKYQQAFQASGKAIQVATDCIDTILALK